MKIYKSESSSNIKNMTVSGGYLALNLNNNINSVFNLYQEFIPLANTQEKTTTAFGVDVDLEYGMVYFEPRYYTKKVVLNNEEYDFIERSQFVMFSMEKKKGMYKLEMPITSDSKFITFVIRVEPSPITHVAGYPPEEVDKYTLWGEPVINRIYKPNFDEKGEVISWEDIGIPFTVAELNASNYPKLTNGIPFLFPKGTVNFYDLKAEYGDYTIWSSNPNEVIGTNYILNDKGFFLTSGDSKLTLSADEIISFYRDTKIFEIYNEIVFGKNLKSETLNTNGLITKKIPIDNKTSYIRYIEGGE